MHKTPVIAVVGACGPERTAYARELADAAGLELFPAARLALAPDPVDEASALAPWAEGGAVVELPDHAPPIEVIGALASPDAPTSLTALVCVVDAAHLIGDLHVDAYAPARPGHDEITALALLTVTQIEYASTVALVGWERLSTDDLLTVLALVSHLAPGARLTLHRKGGAALVATARFGPRQTRPGWVQVLNGDFDPHMTAPRVTSLHYEQLRPLHPERLASALTRIEEGRFGTVIRSAGFCRLATRPGVTASWDHVGRMISFAPLANDGDGDELLALGQDLAVVGLDLDVAALSSALDAAALSDDELAAGPVSWLGFSDPFPAWELQDDEAG